MKITREYINRLFYKNCHKCREFKPQIKNNCSVYCAIIQPILEGRKRNAFTETILDKQFDNDRCKSFDRKENMNNKIWKCVMSCDQDYFIPRKKYREVDMYMYIHDKETKGNELITYLKDVYILTETKDNLDQVILVIFEKDKEDE